MNSLQDQDNVRKAGVYPYAVSLIALWVLTISGLLAWNLGNITAHTEDLALHEARAFFQEVVTTRSWNASHGGVYVPVTEGTRPNPYLEVPNRDLTTQEGMALTLVNPAFMTRQIGEIARNRNTVWFHITSLNPIRPANAADTWEASALNSFENGNPQVFEFTADDQGNSIFRYMAPLTTEEACLKCHAKQGYRQGDIRGGISVNIQGDAFLASSRTQTRQAVMTYGALLALGIWGIVYSARRLRSEETRKEGLITELKGALERVQVLSGLVPICASCKKIRDDSGFWNKMEEYIQTHSDARFSHGICPDCVQNLYSDVLEDSVAARKKTHSSGSDPIPPDRDSGNKA